MVKEVRFTSINRIMEDITDHPLLKDLTLEQVVRHTLKFIGLHGYSKLYQTKVAEIEIHDFRGALPCDCISINQVRDAKSKLCLRSMTGNFAPGMCPDPHKPPVRYMSEGSFKTQGTILYTSFPEGLVEIDYKAIPLDEEGYPALVDNEVYLAALEAYIKKKVFTTKFETGKLNLNVLQNAQIEYRDLAAQLNSQFMIPSMSEMESITRMWGTLVPRMREFDKGFVTAGDREYLKKH